MATYNKTRKRITWGLRLGREFPSFDNSSNNANNIINEEKKKKEQTRDKKKKHIDYNN